MTTKSYNQKSRTLQKLQQLLSLTSLDKENLTSHEIIGPYKVDIVSNKQKLVIEIDEQIREKIPLRERYFRRDHFLAGLGYKVLRFRKSEIYRNPEQVTRIIEDFLEIYRKQT